MDSVLMRDRWTTLDEVKYVKEIDKHCPINCTPELWLLHKYKNALQARVRWGEIDKGIIQKLVEDEIASCRKGDIEKVHETAASEQA